MMLYDLDRLFQALADPTRRALLRRLAQGPAMVGQLAALFPTISLAAVSKHLHVLERAGLVGAQRQGKFYRFSLQPEALRHTDQWLQAYRAGPAVALLGLSANPPHAGHLAISQALLEAGYAEVWWSIAPQQEFKPASTLAPYKHRRALAELLLAGQKGVCLDDTEATLPIKNEHFRTAEWLAHLAALHPGKAFTFVMGADSWAHPAKGFHTWGGFKEVLDFCGVLVIPRPNVLSGHATGLDDCPAALALQDKRFTGDSIVPRGQWALYPRPVAEVSSTGIRAALTNGGGHTGLSAEQLDYIRRHGLYGAQDVDQ